MTPSKEQIEAWVLDARDQADATNTGERYRLNGWYEARDEALATLAYAAGRRAGMEEAAKICDGEISGAIEDVSRAIQAAMEADHG